MQHLTNLVGQKVAQADEIHPFVSHHLRLAIVVDLPTI
jgi:hypothetical protein